MKKILFVCLGNICRSSSAEGVMKHLVEEAGRADEFLIDSAGILSYHQGELPDSRMMPMQIISALQTKTRDRLAINKVAVFGRTLKKLEIPNKKSRQGTLYHVMPLD